MPRRDSLLTRGVEPLFAILWPLFVVWTIVVAVLWTTGFAEEQLKASISSASLRDALALVLRSADTLWIILATVNLYLALAERTGLGTARLWALVILVVGASVAAFSVHTGLPLGSIAFTTRLGMKLGPVPLGWPLWWFVVVVGARMLAERLLPRASHAQLAAATGALALLTAWNLEPLAWKVRLFWFWYQPGTPLAGLPPWHNYATWGLVTTALAFFLREPHVVANPVRPSWRPALVLIFFNAIFILTHVVTAFQN